MDRPPAPSKHTGFGEYLRRHRERRHLSLIAAEALSASLGGRISRSNLSRIENSQGSPNLASLGTLALLYDVPLSELVERYEIDRRLQQVMVKIEGKSHAQIIEEARQHIRAGRYLEALTLVKRYREWGQPERVEVSTERAEPGVRRLRLIELQCMLHLGFYECARTDAERLLSSDGLGLEDKLIAWHCFVACSLRLERFRIAEAALGHVEELLRSPEAPARYQADFTLLRGNLFFLTTLYEDALRAYSRSLKLFEDLSNHYEVCRCRILVGGTLIELDKHRTARQQLERALTVAGRAGYGRLKSLALSNLAKLTFRAGRHHEAENFALRSNRIARDLEYEPVLFRNTWYLREIALARSDSRAAGVFEHTLLLYLNKAPGSMPEAREFRERLRRRRARKEP